MNEHPCPDRSLFAAVLTGDLPAADEAEIRLHLPTCAACAREMADLASVIDMLKGSDLTVIDRDPTGPPAVTATVSRDLEYAIFDRIASERRRLRIRRTAIGVAASLLLVSGVAIGLTVRSTPRDDRVHVALDYPVGGRASVALTKRTWGTEIRIETSDLPAGLTYGVWLERPDGSRVPAGSFTSVAARTMTLRFSSALPPQRATAIGMTDFATKKEVRVLLSTATADR